MKRWQRNVGKLLVFTLGLTLALAATAFARSDYRTAFNTKYGNGYNIGCDYCHPGGETSEFNLYALDLDANGITRTNINPALTAVEPLDSDGDGFTNLDEIIAKTLPYDAANFPVIVGPTCTDNDGDSFFAEGGDCGPVDCNDSVASINPGAEENCSDGIDNNCNGLMDVADPNAVSCPVDQKSPGRAGVFRNGNWFIDSNRNMRWDSGTDITMGNFGGTSGDLPVIGDWNGDGFAQIGVYRNGLWYLDANSNGRWDAGVDIVTSKFGGVAGDIPVTGDWNGDGSTDIGIYRNGNWYLDANGNRSWDSGDTSNGKFGGVAGDIPVTGDWNGDGITNIGVYRNGTWYLDANGNRNWDAGADIITSKFGGVPGDIPVASDWNGDGKTQIGVYRNGSWYADINDNYAWDAGIDTSGNFGGTPSDIPIIMW
jgi:hypothetical protein